MRKRFELIAMQKKILILILIITQITTEYDRTIYVEEALPD